MERMAACRVSGQNSELRFSVQVNLCLGCRRGPSHSQEQEEQEEVEEGNHPHRPGIGWKVGPHRFGKLAEGEGSLQNQHRLQFSIKSQLR